MLYKGKMAVAVTATALIAIQSAAAADTAEDPLLSGALSVEVQNDNLFDADDGSEANDLYATIEAQFRLRLSKGLSLQLGLTAEPVADPVPGVDRVFEDHGAYVDTLLLAYESDGWFAYGGKFTPAFGIDPDLVPGLYGDTLSANYELVERLGIGTGYEWEIPEAATISVQAALFKRDTTALSNSVGTKRGRLRESDGGPGNTSGLESFALAVDVKNLQVAPALSVRASALRQAPGVGDADEQWAYGLGGVYELDLGNDTFLMPMVDFIRSTDAIGVESPTSIGGAAETYLTAGLGLVRGPWNAAVTGGRRTDSQPGQPDTDDTFVQLSGGYDFENGIGVQAGWLRIDQAGLVTQTVGGLVSYGIEF
ncbi:MAG: hypothetical protein H3C38_04905 [Rhodospirillales bacterium]|nr:hypothetical protein [Rhodospirillales bacterium]